MTLFYEWPQELALTWHDHTTTFSNIGTKCGKFLSLHGTCLSRLSLQCLFNLFPREEGVRFIESLRWNSNENCIRIASTTSPTYFSQVANHMLQSYLETKEEWQTNGTTWLHKSTSSSTDISLISFHIHLNGRNLCLALIWRRHRWIYLVKSMICYMFDKTPPHKKVCEMALLL